MTEIICPFCKIKLKKYGGLDNDHFYCNNRSCVQISDFQLSSVTLTADKNELNAYRFAFKNKFLLEADRESNKTILKSLNHQGSFEVIAKTNYFPLFLDSDWLQELEPVFRKLKLYSVLR